jgi:hypothetical protein
LRIRYWTILNQSKWNKLIAYDYKIAAITSSMNDVINVSAVDCGKVEPPENGAIRGRLTIYPNKVTFSCSDGFDLIGSPELQCLASGQWSNNTPACKGKY